MNTRVFIREALSSPEDIGALARAHELASQDLRAEQRSDADARDCRQALDRTGEETDPYTYFTVYSISLFNSCVGCVMPGRNAGNGCERCSSASVSLSSAGWPELRTMRCDRI